MIKWLFRRNKPKTQAATEAAEVEELVRRLDLVAPAMPPLPPLPAAPASVAPVVERSQVPTKPLAPPIEPRDALLLFARDYLIARGARVRVEQDDLVSATFPDGATTRYTTTLARARAEEETQLLVRGGGVLADLVDECADHARVTALRLAPICDPLAIAREAVAAPAAGCLVCTQNGNADVLALCERCPLRAGRFALAGVGRVLSAQIIRQEEAPGIELTYLLTASDRQGRQDEWLRVAFDLASGAPIDVLPIERRLQAEAGVAPSDLASQSERAQTWAEARLAPAVEGAATLLRLRSEGEFLAKLDDIRHTHERLQREHPDEADAIAAALEREVERLRDVYAIDVAANLDSIAYILTPRAEVALRTQHAGVLHLTVDLGRGIVQPLVCVACGAASRAGSVCAHGHFTCSRCSPDACSVCAGSAPAQPLSALSETVPAIEPVEALTLAQLDAMTPDTWHSFVLWLLEREQFAVERNEPTDDGLVVYGSVGETPAIASALRLPVRWALTEGDVQRVAAARAGASSTPLLLISTAPATVVARESASRFGVRLIDRAELQTLLLRLSSAHLDAREEAQQEAVERAEVAIATRQSLLGAVGALEEQLTAAANTRRASGGKSVGAAVATISDVRREAQRAFLVWETLIADWLALFGELEARDGTLSINATPDFLRELADRAEHLRDATLDPFRRFAATQGTGDLGYGAWRKALLEEWTARCEALRWRLLTINPAEWRQFNATRDAEAQGNAANADAAATHAAARVQKAQSQMEGRIRLPKAAASGE